jgi:predicted ATPase
MVTIAGVGGVGKTTLAVQVARAQQQSVPDGVWLIELADLTDGALLTEVTAAAVGVRDQSGRPLIGVLIDFLHPREVLLVLDNCEHLVEAAAQFTETLLRNCPRLKILTTSREILGIPGESVLPLAPLACPRHDDTPALTTLSGYDSVQLFVERARAAVPGFNLSERNAAAVLRICTQLDGLPLALELAAARLRAMSVRHIADGLAEGYGLLSHTRRGAPHRQQTLRGCVRWSFDLCTPQEQQLWARLSVFSGGFELAAAQYVCGGDIDAQEVFDLVAALVDKSILIRSETGDTVRYRLLESLRDYGKARLAEATGNYPQLARRHLEWYRRLLADATPHWWGPQHMERLLHISADMANVREALQFALTDAPAAALDMVSHLRPLWTTRGMLSEGHRWATMALDATATEVNTQRIQALFHAAVLAGMRGELPSARRSIDTARGHLVMVADASGQAAIDAVDGFVALQEGQLDRARTCLQSALRTGQDIEVRAVSLMLMGWTQAICGDIDEAVTWSEKALALAESHGDLVHRSQALANIGAGRWLNGQWSQAHDLMREGLQIAQLLNDTWTGAQLVEMLAWIYAEQDARRATTLMAAAAALSGLSGAPAIPYAQVGAFHADCEHRCRQQLGEAEYAAAWREGSALNFDQAVGVALADTAAASP